MTSIAQHFMTHYIAAYTLVVESISLLYSIPICEYISPYLTTINEDLDTQVSAVTNSKL